VQVFDETGKLLLFWGTSGQEAGKFWLPAGLLIDAQDRIYVADSYNNRVQIFQYLGDSDAR
jgi:DNA-binding beta-propeller fold protein YncE